MMIVMWRATLDTLMFEALDTLTLWGAWVVHFGGKGFG